MKTVVFRYFSVLLCTLSALAVIGICMAIPAAASDGGWDSVIRPGVNAGTGTADYTVELLSPLYQTGSSMIFFNPRFRINPGHDDEYEYNAGLGYRRLVLGDEWFVGGNVFYDGMESGNGFHYDQIGLGVEARSKWFDAILNGYVQAGETRHRVVGLDRYALGSHALIRRNGFEEAMSGMDGEAGVLIPYLSDFVETRAYVGGYWWLSDVTSDIAGVRARVEVNPVPLLTMNAVYSYDDVHDAVWRGEAYLNIPFSFENAVQGKNPFEGFSDALGFGRGPRDARARMTDRVERDRYIRTRAGAGDAAAEVHSMVYVNNANSTGTEDGSLEHPYSTLAGAAADISARADAVLPYIYIFKGAGPYAGGLSLADGSSSRRSYMVWGEHYTLPGLATAGYPVLDGSGVSFNGGPAAADITVRGLNVRNSATDGINVGSIHTAEIYDNVVTGCSGDGIFVFAEDAALDSWDTSVNINANRLAGNDDGIGCFVYKHGTGNVNVTIADNNASLNNNDGIRAFVGHYGTSGNADLTIANNIANGNSYNNIQADTSLEGAQLSNLTVSGNQANGSQNLYGILIRPSVSSPTAVANVTVAGNTANNNNAYNIILYGDGPSDITISGNQANGCQLGSGIYVKYSNINYLGDISVRMDSNTALSNAVNDFYIRISNGYLSVPGGNVNLSGSGNTIDPGSWYKLLSATATVTDTLVLP